MSHFQKALFRIAILSFALGIHLAYTQETNSTPAAPPPVAYASVNELNNVLGQLRQTAQNIQTDLGKMRIEKWKTDASSKRQAEANVESIQRNLQAALPEVMTQLDNAPEDLGASFKLYRNLDALYGVFGSVVELAGAFGSKDEFQSLSNDMNALEGARRSFGERMQNLANAKETELARLRGQIKAMQAVPPAPPKKIVVDDNEPPQKPVKKKPAAKPTTAAPGPAAKPPSSPPAK